MKSEAFRMLSARGASKAVVTFSGGNDEGDVESITLFINDGQYELEPVYYGDDTSEPSKRLAELLAQPVWDRYGGFGGDFQVYGNVTWDVATQKVTMSKSESEYREESFEL